MEKSKKYIEMPKMVSDVIVVLAVVHRPATKIVQGIEFVGEVTERDGGGALYG